MESIAGDQDSKAVPNALVITINGPGHITPMLRMATELARRGITITFVCTEDAISGITSADGHGSSSELQGLDLRFVGMRMPEGQGQRLPSSGRIPGFVAKTYGDAFKPVMEKLLHDKGLGITGPTCMIADMFLGWTQDAADELQIPMYLFISTGVVYARALQGFLPYYESGKFQISETTGGKELVAFDWSVCIPGVPPLRYDELPPSLREDPDDFRQRCEGVGQSEGIVVNSFLELEEMVIETWTSVRHPGSQHIKVPKIFPIGPMFSPSAPDVRAVPRGLEDSASKCLLWLGSQPSSSVLYISFGSLFSPRPEQLHELALGLEDSEQRFLWVMPQRQGSSEEKTSITQVLPPGFEDRVGNRACMVNVWAPQLQILAHAATGGFVTHSGWNSTLESIIFGVPMISWPQGAEQYINCRYVVDDLKVAEQLQTGPENILKRSEVERAVRLLMVESRGKTMRSRVRELQRKAAAAVADGGSQSKNFKDFVDDVRKH